MTQAERVSFLSIATVCLYGFSIYLNYGKLIFPFPIFDLVLLVASISLLYIEYKLEKSLKILIPGIFYVLFVLLNLSQNAFLGTFLDENQFLSWSNSLASDLIGAFAELIWLGSVVSWFAFYFKNYLIYSISLVVVYALLQMDSFQVISHLLPLLVFGLFTTTKTNVIWKNAFLIQGIFNLLYLYMFLIAE